MIFWLQRKWLKMTDVIEEYWSWSNVIKLCAANDWRIIPTQSGLMRLLGFILTFT